MNAKIPDVKIPGFANGIIMLIKALKFDAPSIFADSSNAFGIVSKYGIIIHIIVGRETIK